jgi:6-pyruvoyltetrahydropterin/6-carboxytetrahydropterin synthase
LPLPTSQLPPQGSRKRAAYLCRLKNGPAPAAPLLLRARRLIPLSDSAMLYVSRREHFNAAHKLYNPAWTPERNKEVFGPCANENWHGHNYEMIVTVKGQPDPDTGFVVDLKALSDLIRVHITDQVDHKNLNLDVPFLQGKLASTENLAVAFWQILERELTTITVAKLYCIKIYETPRNAVEYYG